MVEKPQLDLGDGDAKEKVLIFSSKYIIILVVEA